MRTGGKFLVALGLVAACTTDGVGPASQAVQGSGGAGTASLRGVVFTVRNGPDSTRVPVAGATVTLVRVGDLPVDSTPPDTMLWSGGLRLDRLGFLDSVPTDTIPTDTIPTDTIPTDTIPTDTIPTDTIPTDTNPPRRRPHAATVWWWPRCGATPPVATRPAACARGSTPSRWSRPPARRSARTLSAVCRSAVVSRPGSTPSSGGGRGPTRSPGTAPDGGRCPRGG